MAPNAARSFLSRAGGVLAFVAIVWGVAATFVLFEIVSLTGFDFALSFPQLTGGVALSPVVTQSTSCEVSAGQGPESRTPVNDQVDARVDSWTLGVALGRDAVVRQYVKSDRQILDQLAAGRNELAARLSVPPPDAFTAQQLAAANGEFITFVEQGGASETARRLALAFSPDACELFKLGAFWGYSEMVRPLLPGERAVFAFEIRHHALRARIPEPLWSPMLQRTPADANADDVTAQLETLNNSVTTYLAGQR